MILPMKILITGGSGLLGSKISEIAIQKGHETYSGYNTHESTYGIPIKLDITNNKNVQNVFEMIQPEVVIHAAALTNVDTCEKDKELARKINVEGTRNIVESSECYKAFLVSVSTDYIFSGKKGMYNEANIPRPINNYGATKLEAEVIVKNSITKWCIARTSVIYGATPAAGKINFALWVLQKLKKGEKLNIITDQWVSPTLNTNLTEMIFDIIELDLLGTYHLAGATSINRYNFALLVAETFQLDKKLISPAKSSEMNWFAKRPENSSLNVEKASKTLKNKPLDIFKALSVLRKEIYSVKN